MANQVILSLGDYVFTRLEIPTKINIGGEQRVVVHELIGGTRIVDVLGKIDDPMSWAGVFYGADAHDRAKAMDNMRKEGKPLILKWGKSQYEVVITKFTAEWEKFYQIPYSITCIVVKDFTSQTVKVPSVDIDAALRADIGAIVNVTFSQANPTAIRAASGKAVVPPSKWDKLMAGIKKLKALYDKYTGMVAKAINWTNGMIRDVKQAIEDIQREVMLQLTSITNFLNNVSTLGGLLPHTPVSRAAARLSDVVAHTTDQYQLLTLQNNLSHMNATLPPVPPAVTAGTGSVPTGSVTSSGKVVNSNVLATETVLKASLFKLASKYYGDVTKWDTIAKANGLTSPDVTAPMTIIIPKV